MNATSESIKNLTCFLVVIALALATMGCGGFRSGVVRDDNRDGFIHHEEMIAHAGHLIKETNAKNIARAEFSALDENGDGAVSIDEASVPRLVFSSVFGSGQAVSEEKFESSYPQLRTEVEEIQEQELGWFVLSDRDSDGVLSADEVLRATGDQALYRRFDLDRDSVVSMEEARLSLLPSSRWRPIRAAEQVWQSFEALDVNKNEWLDDKELGFRRYLIRDLDRDADGRLSEKELAVIARLAMQGPDRYDTYKWESRFYQATHREKEWLEYDELGNFEALAVLIDKDKNRRISIEEYIRIPEAQFYLLRPAPIE